MIRLFVVLAFFVSGASSLMLEVVWSKGLGQVLGNTLEAITTVVAAYMGGLAIGASWAGRTNAGQKNPVRTYGLLEIGIGLFGLVSPFLIRAIGGPLGAAYAALGATSPVYGVVRFLGTFALLLLPTTLMGATLPILVQWGARRAELARVLGTLYAVNTAGAVLGTVLAGFILLPSLGLSGTAFLAGGTSLALGVAMALASRSMPESRGAEPKEAATKPAAAAPKAAPAPEGNPQLMLALFAVSGAVSLSTQIAWTRVAAILLGSSVYSFSLVLATFLVGIAAGAALIVPWLARHPASWRLFAVLQWIAGAGILWASVRIADAPWDLLARVVTANGNVQGLWIQESLLLAGFMLPACLAFGAIFPVATRLTALPGDTPAHTTGRAYGWNTLGTITGSLLAGYLLVHVLGMRGTLLAVSVVALLVGGVAWFASPAPVRRKTSIPEGAPIAKLAVPALVLAVFVLGLGLAPNWNRGLLAIGVFRPLVATEAERTTPAKAREALRTALSQEETVQFVEGRQGTVSVHRTFTTPPVFAIRFNGKTDASTGIDMRTQILAGQLPMMWSADSARVVIIGYGSGVTVGSALTHPLRSVDVVEIEPAVLAADEFFRPYNGNPTADPRTRVHIDDGRMFIAHAREPYDVIISEPSNPWLAGVNNLFTVDFYRLVKAHLAKGGVFCQWMQFYEMSGVTLSSLMRSLHEVFPEAQAFLVGRDILFVAAQDARPLDLAQVARRLARPEVAKDLGRADVANVADLVAYHQGSLANVIPELPAAPLNRDDRPFVEYRAPVDLYSVKPSENPFEEQAIRRGDPLADLDRWTEGVPPLDLAAAVTTSLMSHGNLVAANRWLGLLGARDSARAQPLFVALRAAAQQRDVEQRIARAAQLFETNDLEGARHMLDPMLAESPVSPLALISRGRISLREDSLAAARHLFERALASSESGPDQRYDAQVNLGVLSMRENRIAEGLAHFESANAIHPEEPSAWLYRGRVLAQTGRSNEARLLLEQARPQVRDASAIDAALRQLNNTGTLQ